MKKMRLKALCCLLAAAMIWATWIPKAAFADSGVGSSGAELSGSEAPAEALEPEPEPEQEPEMPKVEGPEFLEELDEKEEPEDTHRGGETLPDPVPLTPEDKEPSAEEVPLEDMEEIEPLMMASFSAGDITSSEELVSAVASVADGESAVIELAGDIQLESSINISGDKTITFTTADGVEQAELTSSGGQRISVVDGGEVRLIWDGVRINGSISLDVTNDSVLHLEGLEVTNFSTSVSYRSAVQVAAGAKAFIKDCYMHDNQITGAYQVVTVYGELDISGSRFENSSNTVLEASSAKVTIDDSEFIGNSSVGSGGAIYANRNSEVEISNSLFQNNKTGNFGSGGAIQMSRSAVSIHDSVFTGNHAEITGGAIITYAGELRITGNTSFTQNSAASGGGITLGMETGTGTEFTILGNSDDPVVFSGNRGGGLYTGNADVDIRYAVFSENTRSAGAGIYLHISRAAINDVTFENNVSTGNGAGIFVESSQLKLGLDESGNGSVFRENKAGAMGGGIMLYQSEAEIGSVEFLENSGTYGGGMVVYSSDAQLSSTILKKNEASDYGGGLYAFDSDLQYTGRADRYAEISHNTAGSFGGGIYIQGSSGNTGRLQHLQIVENEANHGGGIGFFNIVVDMKDIDLTDNTATGYGGGMYAQNTGLDYCGSESRYAEISRNRAGSYGGGLYLQTHYQTPYNLHYLNVEENTSQNGGGIAVRGVSQVFGSHLDIIGNTARNNGGGLSVNRNSIEGGPLGGLTEIFFSGNKARTYVNVLAKADFELYRTLQTMNAIKDVKSTSLDSSVPMHYLDNDGGLVPVYSETDRAYNNYDIAYNEVIFELVYHLHSGVMGDGRTEEEIQDDNHYGSGMRAMNSPGADSIPIHLIADEPLISNSDGLLFAGWAQSLEMNLLSRNSYGAPVIDMMEMENYKIHLHARYKLKDVTVKFYANGGVFDSSAQADGTGVLYDDNRRLDMTVLFGGDIDEPSEYVAMEERYFSGWYTEPIGGALANLTNIRQDNLSVYAHWVTFNPENQYRVIYYMDHLLSAEPEVYYSESYPENTAVGVALEGPERSGYLFDGWYELDASGLEYGEEYDFTKVHQAGEIIRLFAKWKVNRFDVKLINDESSEEIVTLYRNSVKITDKLEPGQDIALSDVSTADVITITRPYGSIISDYMYEARIDGEEVYGQYHPNQTGDGFDVVEISAAVDITVQTELRRYVVSFYEDEGSDSHLASFTVKHGYSLGETLGESESESEELTQLVSKPADREGYVFAGWLAQLLRSASNQDSILNTPVYRDTSYYAIWEEDSKGGSKKPKPDTSSEAGKDEIALDKENHYAYVVGYPASSGSGDGEIRPNAGITREEAATIFFRLLTDDSRASLWSQSNSFSDVDGSRWSNTAISTMANGGIVKGYPNPAGDTGGIFRPEDPITRAELASLAVRFENKEPSSRAGFSDTAGHWAESSISLAVELGYVTGYEDGTFHPDESITRAEVMTLLNRVLGRRLESVADLLDGMMTWSDNQDTEAWYYLEVQEAGNSQRYEMKEDGVHKRWIELRRAPDWSSLEQPGGKLAAVE